MTRVLPLLPLLFLLGCPKKPVVSANQWEEVPHLPSPTAGSYTRSKEISPDPPIARLVKDKRWDASLSGAAGNLAVQLSNPNGPKALTRWGVREALWRAGYPYTIADAKAWLAQPDGEPPPQLLTWLEQVGPEDDLGLVRSRGHDEDVFVAMVARPPLDLPVIPRQLAVGGALRLPAVPGATYAVADANGILVTGDLSAGASIDTPSQGEWLVEIRKEQPLATFPVYVGIVPPQLMLIEKTVPVRDANEALARATQLLATIRSAYGSPPPARDFLLDAGARSLLAQPDSDVAGILGSMGIPRADAAVWDCNGGTIEVCIDAMIWIPENRRALLDDTARLGLAASVDGGGVRLVGILTRTD